MSDFIKIYPADNVAVALRDMKAFETVQVDGQYVTTLEDIPNGHKVALQDIPIGGEVVKYGNRIGFATADIAIGGYVHDHNMETQANTSKSYIYTPDPAAIYPGSTEETWMGYRRGDGGVGIRNYLAIIPTVFCANGPLQKLARMAEERYPKNDHFDGVLPLTHPYGCSQTGQDLQMTAATLAGVIRNANFGGVLVLSLGCEMNDLATLKKHMDGMDEKRVKFLVLQESDDEFVDGLSLCGELMDAIEKDRRVAVNLGELHVAVNCGGSDGFSGITANKLVGCLTERLVRQGATVNMTEVPEMFGAEHLLMNRAASQSVFDAEVQMIQRYVDYFQRYGEKVSDNPTQGNKAGGLSTIEEKSLGCIQKGGRCAVMEVLDYGQRAAQHGFILVSGPGNDLAGVTGQIAAGAVLTIFTTGRGTPCGFAGPTFRISSNSQLAKKKSSWIDFDAGVLLERHAQADLEALTDALYAAIRDTCNGEYRTRNEDNGYYQMGILRDGVTL